MLNKKIANRVVSVGLCGILGASTPIGAIIASSGTAHVAFAATGAQNSVTGVGNAHEIGSYATYAYNLAHTVSGTSTIPDNVIMALNTTQRKIQELWIARGCTYDAKGFAKFGEQYMAALPGKYGSVGDNVTFYFDDDSTLDVLMSDMVITTGDGSSSYGTDNGKAVLDMVGNATLRQSSDIYALLNKAGKHIVGWTNHGTNPVVADATGGKVTGISLSDLFVKLDSEMEKPYQGDAAVNGTNFLLLYFPQFIDPQSIPVTSAVWDEPLVVTGVTVDDEGVGTFTGAPTSLPQAYASLPNLKAWPYKVDGKDVLPEGTYVLVETKPGSGYRLSSGSPVIWVRNTDGDFSVVSKGLVDYSEALPDSGLLNHSTLANAFASIAMSRPTYQDTREVVNEFYYRIANGIFNNGEISSSVQDYIYGDMALATGVLWSGADIHFPYGNGLGEQLEYMNSSPLWTKVVDNEHADSIHGEYCESLGLQPGDIGIGKTISSGDMQLIVYVGSDLINSTYENQVKGVAGQDVGVPSSNASLVSISRTSTYSGISPCMTEGFGSVDDMSWTWFRYNGTYPDRSVYADLG